MRLQRSQAASRPRPSRPTRAIHAPAGAWHNARPRQWAFQALLTGLICRGFRGPSMTFVVTENCIKCKYMDCVEVCPVDCFHEGPNFLVIDPDECIDCTLCEPECPVEAIFSEEELPAGQEQFRQLNAELAKHWPVITEKKAEPPDAKEWEGKPDKTKLLER